MVLGDRYTHEVAGTEEDRVSVTEEVNGMEEGARICRFGSKQIHEERA